MRQLLPVLLLAIGLTGCFEADEINGYSVDISTEYPGDRYIEIWYTEAEGKPNSATVIGPSETLGWGGLYRCRHDDGRGEYLKVVLRDVPPEISTSRVLDSKAWTSLKCHEHYSLVIDGQSNLTLYSGEQYQSPYKDPIAPG